MSNITIKKREVPEAFAALGQIATLKLKRKLAYAVAKNRRRLQNEMKDLQEAQNFPDIDRDDYKAWEAKRKDIADKYAERGPDGKRVESRGGFRLANPVAYEEELDKWLQFAHPQLKKDFDEHERQLKELFDSTVEIDIHDMDLEDFPEEFLPEALGICVDWIKA